MRDILKRSNVHNFETIALQHYADTDMASPPPPLLSVLAGAGGRWGLATGNLEAFCVKFWILSIFTFCLL